MPSLRYRMLGIDDDCNVCDCCGKKNLKCTVALSELDSDGNETSVVKFGRDCASKALGLRRTAGKMEMAAREASATALAAGFRNFPQKTIGEGWWKMTVWMREKEYAFVTTAFSAPDIRRNLISCEGGDWRYIGADHRTGVRVFQRLKEV